MTYCFGVAIGSCYTNKRKRGCVLSRVKIFIKKLLISLVGFPILIIGIILIPLPGPGILVTLLGLFILSFAFESLKPHLERYKTKLRDIIKKSKDKQNAFLDKHDQDK